jgi:hypothetical protein
MSNLAKATNVKKKPFLGLLVSSTKKADRYDINEILLRVALNTIKINKQTH